MGNTRVTRPVVFRDTDKARFDAKTAESPDGCLIWQAAVEGYTGYGAFKVDGRKINSHVAAYLLATGRSQVPVGAMLLHDCHNKLCVRVGEGHLRLGTHSENMQQSADRGDLPFQSGAQNLNARLTEAAVLEARQRCAAGETVSQLASEFGVNRRTLRKALRGETWKHLPGRLRATGGYGSASTWVVDEEADYLS